MSFSTLYSQTRSAIITFGVSKEQHTSIQSSNVSGFHILYLLHIQLMDIWFTSWNTLISILFVDRYMYTCLFSWNNGIWLYIMEELNRQQKKPFLQQKRIIRIMTVSSSRTPCKLYFRDYNKHVFAIHTIHYEILERELGNLYT